MWFDLISPGRDAYKPGKPKSIFSSENVQDFLDICDGKNRRFYFYRDKYDVFVDGQYFSNLIMFRCYWEFVGPLFKRIENMRISA